VPGGVVLVAMIDVSDRIQTTIDQLVESGAENGLQVAVYRGGELVVDAVAGVADSRTGRPVTSDTPFYTYSLVKAAASTLVHMLVERGTFGYDTPIAELWPEFAAHGKGSATIRHALTHTVGVPGVPAATTPEDLCDWDRMCRAIADATPWWEPGTKTGYHAYTFGYIVGEVIRRATGKRVSQLLREEIGEPLGIAGEVFFGMPTSELGRLARQEDMPGAAEAMAAMPADSPMFRAGPLAVWPNAAFGNREDILMADIPAGGKNTARAIARMYAALMGEVGGVRLISEERLRTASAVAFEGVDQVFGFPTRWALGYGVGRPSDPPTAPSPVIGIGGVGGSYACADTSTRTAIAVSKNRLTPDFAAANRIVELVLDS
jgi:CubicO group peptidase (beta-lactamase class C family)